MAQEFLAAWERADYNTMYSLVCNETQARLSPEAFANRYTAAQSTATAHFVRAQLRSALQEGEQLQRQLSRRMGHGAVRHAEADHEMTLSLQDGQWRVNWEDGLVWPDLKDGGQFQIQYQIPRRANIYDREGKGLAVDGKIVTVGIVPGEIKDEATLLAGLSPIVNLSPDDIKAKYASAARRLVCAPRRCAV